MFPLLFEYAMKRRDFSKYVGLGATTSSVPGLWQNVARAEGSPARKPNILFFFTDQHRFDWTSLDPALPDLTPNLRQLARQRTCFSQVCRPQSRNRPPTATVPPQKQKQG